MPPTPLRPKPILSGTKPKRQRPTGLDASGASNQTYPKKRVRQDDGDGALKLTVSASKPAANRKQKRKQLQRAWIKQQQSGGGAAAEDDKSDDASAPASDADDDDDDAGAGDVVTAVAANPTAVAAAAAAAIAGEDDGDESTDIGSAQLATTWQAEDLEGKLPELSAKQRRAAAAAAAAGGKPIGIDIPILTAAAAAAAAANGGGGDSDDESSGAAPVAAGKVLTDSESAALRATLSIHAVMTPASTPLPPVISSFASPLLPTVFGEYMTGRNGRFSSPSAIQCQAWTAILMGYDVVAQASTGSGKTLAYLLPAVVHIHNTLRSKSATAAANDVKDRAPIALAILPTRELAVQVLNITKHFEKAPYRITTIGLYGGARREEQWDALTSKYAQLLVCTPGRLVDFLRGKQVNLKKCTYVVLDEADRMLTLGFAKELNAIFAATSSARQTLCFSATFPASVETALAGWVTKQKPSVRIVIGMNSSNGTAPLQSDPSVPASLAMTGPIGGIDATLAAAATAAAPAAAEGSDAGAAPSRNGLLLVSPHISQVVQCCAPHKKPRKLLKFLGDLKLKEDAARVRHKTSVLIFVNKIQTVRALESLLKKHSASCYSALGLHSQKTQPERDRAMRDFKNGKIPIMIATDVAGRGIDMKNLRVIINYDFPPTLQQYVHRCGRTGRTAGTADAAAAGAGAAAKAASKAHTQGPHAAPTPGIPIVPEWFSGKGLAFSFFTRNRAMLAADLIAILRANAQYIDPNLIALADEIARARAGGGAAAGGKAVGNVISGGEDVDEEEDDIEPDTTAKPAAAAAAPAAASRTLLAAKPAATAPAAGSILSALSGRKAPAAAAPALAAMADGDDNDSDANAASDDDANGSAAAASGGAGGDDSDDDVDAWKSQVRAIPGSNIVLKPASARPPLDDSDSDGADGDDEPTPAPAPAPAPKRTAAAVATPNAKPKPAPAASAKKPAATPAAAATKRAPATSVKRKQ